MLNRIQCQGIDIEIQNIRKMIVSDSWIKSIFVVTIVLTVLRPTTAGLGDFLGSIATSVVNTCHNTACESHPRCPAGFDTLSTSREGKNYM